MLDLDYMANINDVGNENTIETSIKRITLIHNPQDKMNHPHKWGYNNHLHIQKL